MSVYVFFQSGSLASDSMTTLTENFNHSLVPDVPLAVYIESPQVLLSVMRL